MLWQERACLHGGGCKANIGHLHHFPRPDLGPVCMQLLGGDISPPGWTPAGSHEWGVSVPMSCRLSWHVPPVPPPPWAMSHLRGEMLSAGTRAG